jgi:hypothetical protein
MKFELLNFNSGNSIFRIIASLAARYKNISFLLAAIIILATALRFYNADSPLMWLDELATIGFGTGQYSGGNTKHFPLDKIVEKPSNTSSITTAEPIGEICKIQSQEDVHPPFFYIIFYYVRKFWGFIFCSSDYINYFFHSFCYIAIQYWKTAF